VLACRSVSRGQQLAATLKAAAKEAGVAEPVVEVAELDLSSLASVRAFASAWAGRKQPLDCLVNNAGIFDMGAKTPVVLGETGHEEHWVTNFLAPVLLALLLLPSLRAAPGGARVVNVSSIMHTVGRVNLLDPSFRARRFDPTAAYAQSKLASVAFMKELERRAEAVGLSSVRCLSVHPGNVVTGVVRSLPQVVQWLYRSVLGRILLSPEEGARSTVFCAASSKAVDAPRPGAYFDSTCGLGWLHEDAGNPFLGKGLWEYALRELQVDDKDVLRVAAE
jgi:retinol dehydrogenase-12